jgi:hypothetical protein
MMAFKLLHDNIRDIFHNPDDITNEDIKKIVVNILSCDAESDDHTELVRKEVVLSDIMGLILSKYVHCFILAYPRSKISAVELHEKIIGNGYYALILILILTLCMSEEGCEYIKVGQCCDNEYEILGKISKDHIGGYLFSLYDGKSTIRQPRNIEDSLLIFPSLYKSNIII